MAEGDLGTKGMTTPVSRTVERLSYMNVEVSEKGLSEMGDGRRLIFIPREQIQGIEIKFGSRAERPRLQTIFGILLVGLGVAGLFLLENGGLAGFRWGLGFVLFGGVGAFCLYEALIKGYYLSVISSDDTRKLVFKGVIKKTELSNFIRDGTAMGYVFRDSTPDRNIL